MMGVRTYRYAMCAARGMSVTETARLHGVSPQAVRWADQKYGLGFERKRQMDADRDLVACRERLTELVRQDRRVRDIAYLMGVSPWTIKRWCKMWGLNYRQQGGKRPYVEALRPYLTAKEEADLMFVVRRRFTYREALNMIGRPELQELIP